MKYYSNSEIFDILKSEYNLPENYRKSCQKKIERMLKSRENKNGKNEWENAVNMPYGKTRRKVFDENLVKKLLNSEELLEYLRKNVSEKPISLKLEALAKEHDFLNKNKFAEIYANYENDIKEYENEERFGIPHKEDIRDIKIQLMIQTLLSPEFKIDDEDLQALNKINLSLNLQQNINLEMFNRFMNSSKKKYQSEIEKIFNKYFTSFNFDKLEKDVLIMCDISLENSNQQFLAHSNFENICYFQKK